MPLLWHSYFNDVDTPLEFTKAAEEVAAPSIKLINNGNVFTITVSDGTATTLQAFTKMSGVPFAVVEGGEDVARTAFLPFKISTSFTREIVTAGGSLATKLSYVFNIVGVIFGCISLGFSIAQAVNGSDRAAEFRKSKVGLEKLTKDLYDTAENLDKMANVQGYTSA